eukprot:TRINITY_DN30641_c0_g1_i1.p1 TRINITY_DN30641_c0_g1~~TRINITY_DN30641_c0_g1_i1.p1  ORF type:complete len:153 (+),score=22.78 TRINITY_DN30641_c0_g1_i1:62-460(+)
MNIGEHQVSEMSAGHDFLSFTDVLSIMAKWREVTSMLLAHEKFGEGYCDPSDRESACDPLELLELHNFLRRAEDARRERKQRRAFRRFASTETLEFAEFCIASYSFIEDGTSVSHQRDVFKVSRASPTLISL